MKLSPAFSTLSHIIWSGIFGLIIGGGTAVFQYNTTHGINIEQDATLFALTILTGLGSAIIATWNAVQKSPALPEAEKEVESAATVAATQLAQQAHGRIDEVIRWLQNHMQQAHAPMPVQASQNAATPSSLKPTVLQPLPVDSTPVAPVSVPNVAPVGATLLSTIPQMPTVQAQQ